MSFRKELRQALGGLEVLPDDWTTTANVIRETGRRVLGVSSELVVERGGAAVYTEKEASKEEVGSGLRRVDRSTGRCSVR